MTNSEWCRRYRQKTKDRERAVEIGVLAQIRELEMVAALCGRLRDDLHVEVSGVVAAATLECLDSIKDGAGMCRLCLDGRLCLLRATLSATREPQEQESCVFLSVAFLCRLRERPTRRRRGDPALSHLLFSRSMR
jgi:hypothetical protein